MKVRVHLVPALVEPVILRDHCVVLIDAIRASTTLVTAFAQGVGEVWATEQLDIARGVAAELGDALLAGERRCVRPEGFDLGNSPSEYSGADIGGRTLVFTTTNGTRALARAREARTVLVGAFLNRAAVVDALQEEDEVHLLCAGTAGAVTREDGLAAGAMASALAARGAELDDAGHLVAGAFVSAEGDLGGALRASAGGRNLLRANLEGDLEAVARLDTVGALPRLVERRCFRIGVDEGEAFRLALESGESTEGDDGKPSPA